MRLLRKIRFVWVWAVAGAVYRNREEIGVQARHFYAYLRRRSVAKTARRADVIDTAGREVPKNR